MRFPRSDIDPWDWSFVPNLYGLPMKYELSRGVKYRLKGLLGPGSSLRIIDEHGNFRFAAEAQSEIPWALNQEFTMQKDAGDYVLLQYCGEAKNLHFTVDGIDFGHFV